jgi:hypothetical protein
MADPERFQFKVGLDADGVSAELKDVVTFEPDAEGIIAVWRDPADGRTYVVNGHHRLELAKRTGYPTLRCRYLDATDAAQARLRGALINIREGRGTYVDAAKVFREAAFTLDDCAAAGLSIKGSLAKDGLSLARLHPSLFYQVVTGQMRLWRGIIIGREMPDEAEQLGLMALIEQYEKSGKRQLLDYGTGGELLELIRQVRAAGTQQTEQHDLFGTHAVTHSLAIPRAQVASYIRELLGTEKKVFTFVSNQTRATLLEQGGNRIVVDKNSARSQVAAQVLELYDRLANRQGPLADVLTTAARAHAQGDPTAKATAYEQACAVLLPLLGRQQEAA